jgi:hypothetical protein
VAGSRGFDGAVTRWLAVGGFVLLAAGWLCLAVGVLAAGVLNRIDGVCWPGRSWWPPCRLRPPAVLVVIAAMLALAAGLEPGVHRPG